MDKNNHHDSGFGNGFLLGFLLGAAVIFFFFTTRGKKLLKVISEEGIEGIEELKDLMDFETDEDEEAFEEAPQNKTLVKAQEVVQTVQRTGKRFFRGVPKKR